MDEDDIIGEEATAEELDKIRRYTRALNELEREHHKFGSNANRFSYWDNQTRLWWIKQIEKQAAAGKETIGVIVVARVVQIRLDEG
jgi:hypothetical protein